MSEVLSAYQTAKQAAADAKQALVTRLAEIDAERAEIKEQLGRKPRGPKAATPKKVRKARITGIETSEQA